MQFQCQVEDYSVHSDGINTKPIPIDFSKTKSSSFKLKKESIAYSQGVGGISWGSHAIGSWIRDELSVNDHATALALGDHLLPPSNSNNMPTNSYSQSPMLTSSYFPKLENNYCRNYNCCGQILSNLHELLRHYEESHITMSTSSSNDKHGSHNNETDSYISPAVSGAATPTRISNDEKSFKKQMRYANDYSYTPYYDTVPTNDVFLMNGNDAYNSPDSLSLLMDDESIMHHEINSPIGDEDGDVSMADDILPMSLSTQARKRQLHRQNQQQSRCIDDPARHLYVLEKDEDKPFRCQVIGCNKAYKNLNGLKYHKSHGHKGQKLLNNGNGTISVIDPDSNCPYPEGADIEKDKPHRCEICGKRYKNLNGLKYHRGHTHH